MERVITAQADPQCVAVQCETAAQRIRCAGSNGYRGRRGAGNQREDAGLSGGQNDDTVTTDNELTSGKGAKAGEVHKLIAEAYGGRTEARGRESYRGAENIY